MKNFLKDERGQLFLPLSFVAVVVLFLLALLIGGFQVISQFGLYTAGGLIVGFVPLFILQALSGKKEKRVLGRTKFRRK